MAGNQRTSHCESIAPSQGTREFHETPLTISSDEHKRRSPDCLLFTVEPLPKTKAPRARKGRASNSTRASNASVTILSVNDHESQSINLDGDSVLTNTTEATMPAGKGRTAKGTKAKRGRKAATKKTKGQDEAPATNDIVDLDEGPSSVKPAEAPRGKKRQSDELESHEAQHEEAPAPKRRATRTRASAAKPRDPPESTQSEQEDVHMADTEEMKPAPKKAAKGGRKRASTRTRKGLKLSTATKASLRAPVPADEEIDAALEADLERPLTDEEGDPVQHALPEAATVPPQAENPPVKSTASVASTRRNTRVSTSPTPAKRPTPRSSTGTNVESRSSNLTSSTVATDYEPAQAENEPARAAKGAKLPELVVAPSSAPQQVPSPTPSPQSSDAENHPPSARPSQKRPPLVVESPSQSRALRVPLAASTPTNSPSKQNHNRLQTSLPWTAVDIDYILAGTPATDKENFQLDGLAAVLASPEKKMTVEEWISHNAQGKSEKLKADCERMVGKFESEGVRALKSVEGIICSDS